MKPIVCIGGRGPLIRNIGYFPEAVSRPAMQKYGMAADTFKWNTGSDYWKLGDCFNDSLSAIAPDGALYYEAMIALTLVCVVATILAAQPTTAATLSGTVTDASGKPIPDARLDHTGRMVTVAATALAVAPSPDEIRPTPTVTFELRPVTQLW